MTVVCVQGLKETREDRAQEQARADLADVYDGFDMRMQQHWSDKAREDMTERDWRIFREDFSIAYKGAALGVTALPLRNWDEGNLPKPLMKAIERQVCACACARTCTSRLRLASVWSLPVQRGCTLLSLSRQHHTPLARRHSLSVS